MSAALRSQPLVTPSEVIAPTFMGHNGSTFGTAAHADL
jgi:hypothetical protein